MSKGEKKPRARRTRRISTKTPPPVDPTPSARPITPPSPSGISDVHFDPRRRHRIDVTPKRKTPPKSSGPPRAVFDEVPDADDFEEQLEVTPINDLPQMFAKMAKTSHLVEVVAETVQRQSIVLDQIPQVREEAQKAWKAANETREEVIIVRTRQEDMGKRLERIEDTGHSCQMKPRVDALEEKVKEHQTEQEKDSETRIKVKAVEEAVKEVRNERKAMSKTIVGIIVTVLLASLGSAGSGVWYIRGLKGDLQLETQARTLRDKSIDDQLKLLPTKKQLNEQLPTKTDVQKLTTAVKNGDNHEAQERLLRQLWSGLSRSQKLRWCQTKRDQLPEDIRGGCPF